MRCCFCFVHVIAEELHVVRRQVCTDQFCTREIFSGGFFCFSLPSCEEVVFKPPCCLPVQLQSTERCCRSELGVQAGR